MKRRISLGSLLDALPANALLYRFCRRYVNHYNGENNDDMRSNGELLWLREVLPQCKIVFDVGANVGDWTALALSINPLLQVHCFEPCTAAFQRLHARDLVGSTYLNQLGLSDSAEEATIFVFGEGAGTNSLYRRQGINAEQKQTEKVHLDTLDAYCKRSDVQQIDLLKLDVEGHELMVLKGGIRMLSQGRIKRIQFEYGGTFIDARILLKDMFELLTRYSFLLYKIYPNEIELAERYEQRLENFQYQNWVALR